jgi:hypothetical protein
MAEIKSTLDIIMEKAKKFSVTEEEKKAFRRHELEGHIRGLIQKYVDGLMDIRRLKKDVVALKKDEEEELDQLIRQEAIDRIRPGENNAQVLKILSSFLDVDTDPIKRLLDDFDTEIGEERKKCERRLREELRKKGISGSAVIPNPDADQEWRKAQTGARNGFAKALKTLEINRKRQRN